MASSRNHGTTLQRVERLGIIYQLRLTVMPVILVIARRYRGVKLLVPSAWNSLACISRISSKTKMSLESLFRNEVMAATGRGDQNRDEWEEVVARKKEKRRIEKEKKKEGRKIGKVENRCFSLMRSLPGEWKQEKLRTGGSLRATGFSIDTR